MSWRTEERDSVEKTPRPRAIAPEVMIWRLSCHLDALLACGAARRGEDDVIDLFVRAQESATGGMLTITLSMPVRCTCVPTTAACPRCRGTGATDELYSAWLALPPDAPDGTILVPSAELEGVLRKVTFRVRRPPAL
jgi:hypothetical protein